MKRADYITDIKAELGDSENKMYNDTQYGNFVDEAVLLYSIMRPLKTRASFELVAAQGAYDERPDGFMTWVESEWGASRRQYSPSLHPQPWAPDHIERRLPRFRLDGTGFYLDQPPTADQISSYGTTYNYWYKAAHFLNDDADDFTSIPNHDEAILKLYIRWLAYMGLATRSDQAEDFVVRYRKMADQIFERLKILLKAAPVVRK